MITLSAKPFCCHVTTGADTPAIPAGIGSFWVYKQKYIRPDSAAAFTKGTAITVKHYFRLTKCLGGELDPKAESVINA